MKRIFTVNSVKNYSSGTQEIELFSQNEIDKEENEVTELLSKMTILTDKETNKSFFKPGVHFVVEFSEYSQQ